MNLITKGKIKILIPLLRRAAQSLKRKEPHSYSSLTGIFADSHELAGFIEEVARQFQKGDFSSGMELWDIFAPTCEWDDAGGSQNFSNTIFALLNPHFRPKRVTK